MLERLKVSQVAEPCKQSRNSLPLMAPEDLLLYLQKPTNQLQIEPVESNSRTHIFSSLRPVLMLFCQLWAGLLCGMGHLISLDFITLINTL
jgi:hypothetical protein